MSHDEFEHADGAYVLGALSPTERRAFEEHLRACESCARSVRELAGMPGLLAQVDPAVVESPEEPLPVPDTLLPALLKRVRRGRRRRLAWSLTGAAAAVLLGVTGATIWAQDGDRPPDEEVAAAVDARAMQQVGQDSVTATLAMEAVPWGTRLELTCTYDSGGTGIDGTGDKYAQAGPPSYALVVETFDGGTEQVATWQAVPGKSIVVPAATAADRTDIASVDVRTTEGETLLELTREVP